MSFETLSPNMNLPIPGVGLTSGTLYAIDVNSCLTLIDQHNHAPGYGEQITPSGLNINTDLPVNNNNITALRSTRFTPQNSPLSGASDLGCLYESGVDLYYNDANGNQVRLTQNGNVAGSPGSIASLTSPASASYVSANSTFVWQSDANTPANLDAASIILRNLTANSHGLTLNPPSAMGADYAITLPSLPGSTQAVTLTNTGTMSTISYDGIGQGMTATGSNAISSVRTRTVGSTVGIGGIAISGTSTGSFSTMSASFVTITNLTQTLTTSGRPVQLLVQPDGVGICAIGIFNPNRNPGYALLRWMRNSTPICIFQLEIDCNSGGTVVGSYPCPSFSFIDATSAGTYTYSLQGLVSNTNIELFFTFASGVAYEL